MYIVFDKEDYPSQFANNDNKKINIYVFGLIDQLDCDSEN